MRAAPPDNQDASLLDYAKAYPQYLLPHHALSRIIHKLTRSKNKLWKKYFTRWFVQHFGVDMSIAVDSNLDNYPDFNSFFTRALKPEARPIVSGEGQIACPVDGTVSQVGEISNGRLFQAKGRDYTSEQLLGNFEMARAFNGGRFATLYLSPKDYHRIHIPTDGTLREMIHIPGRIFSVNPATTRVIPNLFARNERVVTLFDTKIGPMALVFVGAIFVASIETVWSGEVTPPTAYDLQHWQYPSTKNQRISFQQGQEIARFNMGSTVIVLFGPDTIEWLTEITPGAPTRMGQLLATYRVA